MSSAVSIDDALIELAREHAPKVIAVLASRFRDLDLADDAVQEALIEAATRWPSDGVPDKPGAWLNRVAQRKAIDSLRRRESAGRRTAAAAPELVVDPNDTAIEMTDMIIDTDEHDPTLGHDQLRLIFLCCHPALHADAQVALTLRLVGGLTTDEIAAAFLVPTPTLAQRISRAKAKIRTANIPLAMPDPLDERVDAVLTVLYLVFNEGYLSRASSDDDEAMRVDLCEQAIRLTAALATLLPTHAEIRGLLSLALFQHARRATRLDGDQDLVLLDDQDRDQWDRTAIRYANAELIRAMELRSPGRYQLQAMIAAQHANAVSSAETQWPRIAELYRQLSLLDASPVVHLNRAVAVSMADGAGAALALLDEADGLDDYHLFHATRAELLLQSNEMEAAREHFERALQLTPNPAEQRHLRRRLRELPAAPG